MSPAQRTSLNSPKKRPTIPNYHGTQLIRHLIRLRIEAGLDQANLGQLMHLTLQKISRIENGQVPGYHELTAFLAILNVPEQEHDRYYNLWDKARKRGWWRRYRVHTSHHLAMQDVATHKYEFQLGQLPTLLQTEDYARAALSHDHTDSVTIDRHVAVRVHQQQRLHADPFLGLHALIHEPVLYQGIDHAQLTHLLTCAQQPNIRLQIVPQTADLHAGLHGSLVLLSFDDPDQPDIAYTETLLGQHSIEQPSYVASIRAALDTLTSLALTCQQSTALLEKLAAHHLKDAGGYQHESPERGIPSN